MPCVWVWSWLAVSAGTAREATEGEVMAKMIDRSRSLHMMGRAGREEGERGGGGGEEDRED